MSGRNTLTATQRPIGLRRKANMVAPFLVVVRYLGGIPRIRIHKQPPGAASPQIVANGV